MKGRMYEVIMKETDSAHVYTHYGIYESVAKVKAAAKGNGEIIRIKDVTEDFPISGHNVFNALKNSFGTIEANAIFNFLNDNYSNMT